MHVLRFGLENYACFRGYTEVSFISTPQQDQPDFRISHPEFRYGILPVLGVYGANAAGKTQLLEGLLHARDLVRYSFSFIRPEQAIPWLPWRLKKSQDAPPSRFDIDLLIEGVRYHYGFAYNGEAFLEEWLYRWPKGRRQVLFERGALNEEGDPWYFGPSLTGEKTSLANFTRDNSLFLSTAAHHNHEILGRVYEAIAEEIQEDSPIALSGYPLFDDGDPILDPERKEDIEKIIRAFDLGCIGFELEEIPPQQLHPIEELKELMKPEVFESFQGGISQERRFRVRLQRQTPDGDIWSLHPSQESRGTSILLKRINDLLSVNFGLFVVDELDTSLHPDVCVALIDLFTSESGNERQVQLLFSTHNRDLLKLLRRDEVVLVEKDVEGASSVSTAADFKGLRSRDDLRQVYEEGRIGAVPVLSHLDALLEVRDGAEG